MEFSSSIPILNSCLRVKFATNIGFSVTLGRVRHTHTRYITYPAKSLVGMLQID